MAGVRLKAGLAAVAAAALGAIGWACAGGPDAPEWTLISPDFNEFGSAAMLLPSNDTRVNLLLLLADRRGAVVRDPNAKADAAPLALAPWSVISERALPAKENSWEDYDRYYGTRCQSNQAGAAAFIAAVRANRHISEDERRQLIAAREKLSPEAHPVEQYLPYLDCGVRPMSDAEMGALSPAAREFAIYLFGAWDFYAGGSDKSLTAFRELSGASDPWLRETAAYMVGRTLINRALQRSTNEYGSLNEPAKRDAQSAAAAGAAFQAYLKAYPDGRYSNSARGLMRRVYWLTGDSAALAAEYDRQLESPARLTDATEALGLVNEIDDKLPLPTMQPQVARDPVLLAVVDLQRMRQTKDYREYCCGPAITKAEIDGQRALFGNDTELYDYVRAAEALFVRHQPGEVLALLPDAARQQRFTYLQFSRQMLRGLALDATRDGNARAFWLSLLPGAVQPYQREAVELALALHDQKAGRIDRVFAAGSAVTHPLMRAILLEEVAGPELLRRQATAGLSQYEREAALYTLLNKEILRGFYPEFIRDVRLIPGDAPVDAYYSAAIGYSPRWTTELQRPPLGQFGPKAPLGDFGCPALTATLSQLVAKPKAIRARLCLGEYFRANHFVWYSAEMEAESYDYLHKPGELGSGKELFPKGRAYSRLEDYKAIMNDPSASADEKALALNRAVRCYAPSHSNDCGGVEVSLAVRRGWFNRLHAQYPQSRWARELTYYW
jgi:hypothetical protein